MRRRVILLLISGALLPAQVPIENLGKPMRVPVQCTEADVQADGLTCSEADPCPVFLELANVEAAGNKIFLTGNLHTATVTLYSILLASEDGGKTWKEPEARIPSAGLDLIQFFDFQNGWISGADLRGAPRDPFLLLTTDGGTTWRKRPIYEDARVAAIERFWFTSREEGTMLVDARLDNNHHELYETRTGGESWSLKQASEAPIPFAKGRDAGSAGWRLRADAPTKSYQLERREGARWTGQAAFLVEVGSCKP